mgnify:FL=1
MYGLYSALAQSQAKVERLEPAFDDGDQTFANYLWEGGHR